MMILFVVSATSLLGSVPVNADVVDLASSPGTLHHQCAPSFGFAGDAPAATAPATDPGAATGYCELLLITDAPGNKSGRAILRVPEAIFTGAPVDPKDVYQVRVPDNSDGPTWWTRNPQEIPLPPATWGGFAGLVAVAGFGYVRRRRLRVE